MANLRLAGIQADFTPFTGLLDPTLEYAEVCWKPRLTESRRASSVRTSITLKRSTVFESKIPNVSFFVALSGTRSGWLNCEKLIAESPEKFRRPTILETDLVTINYTGDFEAVRGLTC